MKRIQTIIKNIESNKELSKNINYTSFYNIDDFISDAKRYIKAIKQERMMCDINYVSSSGMTRYIEFKEFNVSNQRGRIFRFHTFFEVLGYSFYPNQGGFKISGCGMDMVFHTNYTNIHSLYRLGFVTRKECEILAQKTPRY